jgi:hydrogenase maturation protease
MIKPVERVAAMMRARVIGCGNPLMGNDGAGIMVLRMLQEEMPQIDAVDGGTGGLGLIPLMEGYDKVVIVDAMTGIGSRPGEVRVFYGPPPAFPSSCSLHEIGIGDVIRIAEELGVVPLIVTIGIEVDSITEFSRDIDPEVVNGILAAYDHIKRELDGCQLPPPSGGGLQPGS